MTTKPDWNFSAQQMLAVVNASPAAVAVHDKSTWLGLFSRQGIVEDPVGSVPHVRNPSPGLQDVDPLDPFYETFIAPHDIHFEVDRDLVCGSHVLRDLTIVIRMSTAVVVRVPVHLLYELGAEEGELKIARLAAHWELLPMLQQQLASGAGFVRVGVSSGVRMLRCLGLRGMLGFACAARSVGASGKERAAAIVSSFNASNAERLLSFARSADTPILFPLGSDAVGATEWAQQPGVISLDKVMAAGDVVSATMTYSVGGEQRLGVALFEFDRTDLSLLSLTCYWQREA
jgi:hypothetical protein